jgi:hypothetical protein
LDCPFRCRWPTKSFFNGSGRFENRPLRTCHQSKTSAKNKSSQDKIPVFVALAATEVLSQGAQGPRAMWRVGLIVFGEREHGRYAHSYHRSRDSAFIVRPDDRNNNWRFEVETFSSTVSV